MDNKVIDLTAGNISANIIQPSVNTKVSITEVTTGVPGILSTGKEVGAQGISASIAVTPLNTSVIGPIPLLTKHASAHLSVRLNGFGEESLSNYGALFVRPNSLLNTANVSDSSAAEYLKPVLLETRVSDYSSKIIGVTTPFLVSAKEFVGLLVSSRRNIDSYLQVDENYFMDFTKYAPDTYIVHETSSKTLGSVKAESTQNAEVFSKTSGKQIPDLAILEDIKQALLLKSLVEPYSISEQASIEYTSPKYDNAKQSDQVFLGATTARLDAVVPSESWVLLNNFIREYFDVSTTSEGQVVETSKVLLTQANVTDERSNYLGKLFGPEVVRSWDLKAVLLEKFVENSVYPSDDFYGAATLGDDQTASFTKVLPTLVYAGDTQSYLARFNRPLHEVVPLIDSITQDLYKVANTALPQGVQEQSAKELDKVVEEEFYFGERYTREKFNIGGGVPNDSAPTFETSLGKREQVSSLTTLFKLYSSKSLRETSSVEEQVGVLVEKVLLISTSNSTDNVLLATTKGLVDSTDSTSDLANFSTNKRLKDSASIAADSAVSISTHKYLKDMALSTDDFYGAASVGDDQYAFISKVFQDSISTQDYYQSLYVPTTPLFATSNVTDLYSHRTNKVTLSTLRGINDLAECYIEKLLPLEVAVVDVDSKHLAKIIVDKADWFEYDYISESYTLGGVVTEDQISVQIGTVLSPSRLMGVFTSAPVFEGIKGLQEYGEVSASISFALEYHLQDLLVVTDDFYGLANTEDDQYAQVIKRLVDISTTSDKSSYSVSKAAVDVLYTTEEAKTSIEKVVDIDAAVLKEQSVIQVGKLLPTGLSGVSDDITTQYTSNRILTETASAAAGTPTMLLEKKNFDSSAVADTGTLRIEKAVLNDVIASESYNSKVNAEIAVSRYMEDYTYVISHSLPSMYVFPVDVYLADTTYSRYSKSISQAISVAEQKIANIQNYFPPLFAQVGYIGTNLTL